MDLNMNFKASDVFFTESLQWWAQNGEKDKVNVNFVFGFMVSVPILQ